MGGHAGGGGTGGPRSRGATTVCDTQQISSQRFHTDWRSIGRGEELHRNIQRYHHVEHISCETFKAADILIPDTIDRFPAKIAYFVAVKDHSRSQRFNTEVVTEMAKTAAARFGKIKPRQPRHQRSNRRPGRQDYLQPVHSACTCRRRPCQPPSLWPRLPWPAARGKPNGVWELPVRRWSVTWLPPFRPARLKGDIRPGMDIFDPATPEICRKRNQKKATSVIVQLQATSEIVTPTELIFDNLGPWPVQEGARHLWRA
jgi:hypothetical protein